MIRYNVGDATMPAGTGVKVIMHICNNIGGWGRGFVVALSKKWQGPEIQYRGLRKWDLGETQFVQVDSAMFVANMIAQRGIGQGRENRVDMEALEKCLTAVREWTFNNKATVHCPRIGSGLGGAKWSDIEALLKKVFNGRTEVNVYDLETVPT